MSNVGNGMTKIVLSYLTNVKKRKKCFKFYKDEVTIAAGNGIEITKERNNYTISSNSNSRVIKGKVNAPENIIIPIENQTLNTVIINLAAVQSLLSSTLPSSATSSLCSSWYSCMFNCSFLNGQLKTFPLSLEYTNGEFNLNVSIDRLTININTNAIVHYTIEIKSHKF